MLKITNSTSQFTSIGKSKTVWQPLNGDAVWSGCVSHDGNFFVMVSHYRQAVQWLCLAMGSDGAEGVWREAWGGRRVAWCWLRGQWIVGRCGCPEQHRVGRPGCVVQGSGTLVLRRRRRTGGGRARSQGRITFVTRTRSVRSWRRCEGSWMARCGAPHRRPPPPRYILERPHHLLEYRRRRMTRIAWVEEKSD